MLTNEAFGILPSAFTTITVLSGREIHSANLCATSIEEEFEEEPNQATCQQSPDRERSSRARIGGRDPLKEVDSRVRIRGRGSETKQLLIPPTVFTSISMF